MHDASADYTRTPPRVGRVSGTGRGHTEEVRLAVAGEPPDLTIDGIPYRLVTIVHNDAMYEKAD